MPTLSTCVGLPEATFRSDDIGTGSTIGELYAFAVKTFFPETNAI